MSTNPVFIEEVNKTLDSIRDNVDCLEYKDLEILKELSNKNFLEKIKYYKKIIKAYN